MGLPFYALSVAAAVSCLSIILRIADNAGHRVRGSFLHASTANEISHFGDLPQLQIQTRRYGDSRSDEHGSLLLVLTSQVIVRISVSNE